MIRVEFFCTRCNGSAVRRDPGDEVNTGYVVATAANPSRAKVDIPLVPAGWDVIQGGLVCDACLTPLRAHRSEPPASLPPVDAPDAAEVEAEAARPSPAYPRWPSPVAPFDGT